MSLIQFLRILLARRVIIVTAFLACLGTATIVSLLLPARYKADSKVMLDIVKPDPITGQVMASQFMRVYTQTQIELIKDERTAGRVVDALGWENDPSLIERYNASPDSLTMPLRRWLARIVSQNTDAKLIEGSNIMEISYESSTGAAAKQLADLIRDTFIQESLRFKRETAAKSANWYGQQADQALSALQQSETARTAYARANNLTVTTEADSSALSALSGQAASAAASGSAPVGISPSAAQLDQVEQQLTQAATALGPNHPTFQALQRQRAALQQAVSRERASMASSGPNPAAARRAFEAERSRTIADRTKRDRLDQLQRDVDIKRDQYVKAAQRAADLRLEANSDDSGMIPLGEALTPESPYWPKIPMIIGAAAAAGLGLGIALALLVEFLARRVRSTEDLEYAASAPVLAVIGSKERSRRHNLLVRLLTRSRPDSSAALSAG